MKYLSLFFIFHLFIINLSCKEETVDPFIAEIEQFKKQTTLQFKGNVNSQDVYWRFDNWDNGIGAAFESSWRASNDSTIQTRNFAIYDYELREDLTLLRIFSPAFSIMDSYENKRSIFDVGEKKFRLVDDSIFDGFTIQANIDSTVFITNNGSQEGSFFEIIKNEEVLPEHAEQPDNKKIRIWILVSCNLYEYGGNKIGRIENGRFIAEVLIDWNG